MRMNRACSGGQLVWPALFQPAHDAHVSLSRTLLISSLVGLTGLWSVLVTSRDNRWKASCLRGVFKFNINRWMADGKGRREGFESTLVVEEEPPLGGSWTSARRVIPSKRGGNEVSPRLMRDENKCILYIDFIRCNNWVGFFFFHWV